MKRRSVFLTTAAFLGLAVLVAAGLAWSDVTPNLSGTWRLDRQHSDNPRAMMGRRARGDRAGWRGGDGPMNGDRGGFRHGGGRGGNASGRGFRGMARIPDLFTLNPSQTGLEMADSASAVVERIVIADSTEVQPVDANGVPQLHGTWQGQDLQVEAAGPNGGQVTQTWELAEDGNTLKITTAFEGAGNGRNRPPAFTRVYQRVSGS
jgi:hypothetical protein